VTRLRAGAISASTRRAYRGIVLNGGEFGAGANIGTGSGGTFSNVNRGTYDSTYHYESQTSLNYLAGRGIKVVRVLGRWERWQPTLGAALDSTEMARVDALITRAATAGLRVILATASYGAYWIDTAGVGVRTPIGTSPVTTANYADFWDRVSERYMSNATVIGYTIEHEPRSITGGAATWETASQLAVNAIRANGDKKLILVPTYDVASPTSLATEHPSGPWITDSASNFAYMVNFYPGFYFGDVENGGYTYASANSAAISAGHASLQAFELYRAGLFNTWLNNEARGFIGEFGWPNQTARPAEYTSWDTVAAACLDYFRARRWSWTVWGTGEWWGPYIFGIYSGDPLSVAQSQATIVEARL
jgi:aryl-phospho-beta-D-glucosidase BglC (GH1 family)